MNPPNPLLAVGSIALDSIKTPKGNRLDILGGSASYFTLAASLFTEVRVVGVVGTDFPEDGHALFHKPNVNAENLQIEQGTTFRWGGRYSNDYSSRETLFTELGVFETFTPQIKQHHRDTPFVFLGNIHPSLQLHVLDQMKDDALIVTDTMNLWIDTALSELNDVVAKSNTFLLNDEEAVQLTGKDDLSLAGKHLLERGPDTVIIKKGAEGSLIFQNGDCVSVPVYPGVEVKDPTGAGDSFAGGFLGMLSTGKKQDLTQAVLTGSAVASVTVSDFGVEGLKSLTMEEITLRSQKISSLMSENKILV
tara:strand:+ start:340 stop:1257 length:918 start_codon:yes stop_codon:yes gene_type:complete